MDSRRLTVAQAAKYLSTSESAIRHKVNRSTIPHEKDEETGRVFILIDELDSEELTEDNQRYANSEPSNNERLIAMLTKQLELTQEALAQEREANREQRRLLAAALERIPALEPPPDTSPEPRESPQMASEELSGTQTPQEEERRSWWQRLFGA